MPVMPRMSGKAKKIVRAILGIPANFIGSKKKDTKTQQRLDYEYTRRVR